MLQLFHFLLQIFDLLVLLDDIERKFLYLLQELELQLIDAYAVLLHIFGRLYLGQVFVFCNKRLHLAQRTQAIVGIKHKVCTTNTIQVHKNFSCTNSTNDIQLVSWGLGADTDIAIVLQEKCII